MPAFLGHEVFKNIWWKRERMLCKSWVLSTQIQGGKTNQKHMWPEWLSQAQDKHVTLVVQGCLFISPLCIRALNGPQRSSSNRCCSHEVSGIGLATVPLSSRAFGQYLGTASLALKLLWCLFCWVPVPECPGSAKSYCSHILIVSQSSSQEGGHFWMMRSLWSLLHTHSERWALSPAPRSAQRNRSCLFAALCEVHGKTIDGT